MLTPVLTRRHPVVKTILHGAKTKMVFTLVFFRVFDNTPYAYKLGIAPVIVIL
jgi:hypothetical protein